MSVRLCTDPAGSTRQLVSVDAHTLYVDAVPDSGGGTAPDPHDLFDASLAACKAITASLYARRKGWPLERVVAEVVRDASREREGFYALDVHLAFEGPLDEEQIARLYDIAERCPIQKLMTRAEITVRQHRLARAA